MVEKKATTKTAAKKPAAKKAPVAKKAPAAKNGRSLLERRERKVLELVMYIRHWQLRKGSHSSRNC